MVFAIKYVPFTTARRNVARKGCNFLPHNVIDLILAVKKFLQDFFGFGECPTFIGEFSQFRLYAGRP